MRNQDIETRLLSLLEIKRIRKGLSEEDKRLLEKLNSKYRNAKGELLKGSYFINSESEWQQV